MTNRASHLSRSIRLLFLVVVCPLVLSGCPLVEALFPTYTVTYNSNGASSGSAPDDSAAYRNGDTVTVLSNTGSLARSGYTFAGWNTASNGSGTQRAIGSTFTMGSANVTLYAEWAAPVIRGDLLRCGNSSRDLSVFMTEGVDLHVVVSCDPDEDTQAVMVTRSGKGSFNGSDLRDWVEDGGVVLTEFSSSDEVYNAVFGSGASESGWYGNCTDLAPTVVQFNSDDLFWQENAWAQVNSVGVGCGKSDVGSWPGVVALAGWNADTVAIGYRDYGHGRVWLTEFDWQDNENYPFAYTASLLGYMITHRAEVYVPPQLNSIVAPILSASSRTVGGSVERSTLITD